MSVHDWHAHAAAQDAAAAAPPAPARLVQGDELSQLAALDLGGRLAADLAADLVGDLTALTRVLLGLTTGAPGPVLVEPATGVQPFEALQPLESFAPPPPAAPLVAVVPAPVEPLVAPVPTRVPASRLLVDLAFLDD